jgi:hypothetical protein
MAESLSHAPMKSGFFNLSLVTIEVVQTVNMEIHINEIHHFFHAGQGTLQHTGIGRTVFAGTASIFESLKNKFNCLKTVDRNSESHIFTIS